MLRRLNDSLPELVAGIILYGVLVQLVGVWFAADKLKYTIGLWYGIIIAVGMAINLAKVIYDSVTVDVVMDTKKANYKVISKSCFRYVIVVILFFILGYFKFGNLLMAFAGIMGLKISAYAQPLLKKVCGKWFGGSDAATRTTTEQWNPKKEDVVLPDTEK